MEFFSILDRQEPKKDPLQPFAYWQDFNLDKVLKEITTYWKLTDVSKMYQYFPADEATTLYRRDNYEDVCSAGVYEHLMRFRAKMAEWEQITDGREITRSPLQKKVMTLAEAEAICEAASDLKADLESCQLSSDGFLSLLKALQDYVGSEAFQTMQERATKLRESLSELSFTLTYENYCMVVSMQKVEGSYSRFLNDLFPQLDMKDVKNPIGEGIEITPLEDEILAIIKEKRPEVFRELDRFYQDYQKIAEPALVRLYKEIPFYLSFYVFEKEMREQGFSFCKAEKAQDGELEAKGLYDLALACQNYRDKRPVIDNDLVLHASDRFFVLTGPNQGGKTTFARSLGQLVYFAKMGLHVPAVSAKVPEYHRLLTHFSVEESVETGKGKLAEELTRLRPMLDSAAEKNDFVVINELFTTAANYDANIMGKRVLDHFISLDCSGIYVTHIHELSEERPGIVSLRALLDQNHKQSYKVVRSNEPEGVSAIAIVEKHRMNYEMLTERLRGIRG